MSVEFNKQSIMNKLRKEVRAAIHASAINLQDRIQEKLNLHSSSLTSGGVASPPGSPPGNRTGELSRSIQTVEDTKDPNKIVFRVGSKVKYARIQEFGGRIVAKRKKFLPIPIGIAGAQAMKRAKGNLRNLKLRVLRTAEGKLFLVKDNKESKRRGQTFKVLFKLVKSVVLPARPYFRPAIAEHRIALRQEFKLGEAK